MNFQTIIWGGGGADRRIGLLSCVEMNKQINTINY